MSRFLTRGWPLLLGIVVGAAVATATCWVRSYIAKHPTAPNAVDLRALEPYLGVKIPVARFGCDNQIGGQTVGAVVLSVLHSNLLNVRNRVSLECKNQKCLLNVSDCKPWKTWECGQLGLHYEITETGQVDPQSFECLQVP